MPNMADLKMIIEANPFQKARLKGTISKRGHIGDLFVRTHQSERIIANYGPYTIYIRDYQRHHVPVWAVRPTDIDGRAPRQLELLGDNQRRYIKLSDWVTEKDGVNLRDLAWMMVDQEEGFTAEFSSSPKAHRAAYDDKEDWLREHFGLKPIHR